MRLSARAPGSALQYARNDRRYRPTSKPAAREIGEEPAAFDGARQRAELCGALAGECERYVRILRAFRPVGRDGGIDRLPGDAHGREVALKPERPPSPHRAALDEVLGELRVVEQTMLGSARQRGLDRRAWMATPDEPAPEVGAGIRAQLERAECRSKRCFRVSSAAQRFVRTFVDGGADRDARRGD